MIQIQNNDSLIPYIRFIKHSKRIQSHVMTEIWSWHSRYETQQSFHFSFLIFEK